MIGIGNEDIGTDINMYMYHNFQSRNEKVRSLISIVGEDSVSIVV
jgi:hypothetical protein